MREPSAGVLVVFAHPEDPIDPCAEDFGRGRDKPRVSQAAAGCDLPDANDQHRPDDVRRECEWPTKDVAERSLRCLHNRLERPLKASKLSASFFSRRHQPVVIKVLIDRILGRAFGQTGVEDHVQQRLAFLLVKVSIESALRQRDLENLEW